jgi:cytochrome P450
MSVAASVDERLDGLLASDPAAMADPFPLWRELRESAPVHRHGAVVLVTSYDEVKLQTRNAVGLSSRYGIDGTLFAANRERLGESQRRAQSEIAEFESLYISRSDGDQHERLRNVAHRAFTPRRIADMEASLERYTEDLLDGIAGQEPVDFRERFAYRLPMLAITDMLGVPADKREAIHGWSGKLARNRGGDDPQAVMAAYEAMGQFRDYVENILVPIRESEPSSDLLSALLEAEHSERLSGNEMTATFVVLLFAGHETTTNLISIGLRELLENPEQWQRLREDPEIAPVAVEELLRWVSPVQWIGRVSSADQRIGEVDVAKGETVNLVLAAANRDPGRFANGEELDIGRPESRDHLALGFGPHFCLGNALARMEARIALSAIARRFPDVRLAGEPQWGGNAMLRSMTELPIVAGTDRG